MGVDSYSTRTAWAAKDGSVMDGAIEVAEKIKARDAEPGEEVSQSQRTHESRGD